jgi:spermidine/putrescine transport system substrate-binding protein
MGAEGMFQGPLRRRELLRGGAGLALGLGLAGCGVGNEAKAPKKATERLVKAVPDGDLVYFNWSEYLEPKLIKAFEKQYGVKVRESNFDSMQGMMAKLRSGNRYDLIFPSSEWVDRLRKANQLLKIDKEQLPNAASVYDYFAKPWYDPGADHSVPYAMYASGLIFRKDKVQLTGSWNDLGLPEAQKKVYMLDDYQEVIGAGNLVNGNKLNDTDPDAVEKPRNFGLRSSAHCLDWSTAACSMSLSLLPLTRLPAPSTSW